MASPGLTRRELLLQGAAPPDGRGARTPAGLAAISRELAYSDPRWSRSLGSGAPADRNLEPVLRAPG